MLRSGLSDRESRRGKKKCAQSFSSSDYLPVSEQTVENPSKVGRSERSADGEVDGAQSKNPAAYRKLHRRVGPDPASPQDFSTDTRYEFSRDLSTALRPSFHLRSAQDDTRVGCTSFFNSLLATKIGAYGTRSLSAARSGYLFVSFAFPRISRSIVPGMPEGAKKPVFAALINGRI